MREQSTVRKTSTFKYKLWQLGVTLYYQMRFRAIIANVMFDPQSPLSAPRIPFLGSMVGKSGSRKVAELSASSPNCQTFCARDMNSSNLMANASGPFHPFRLHDKIAPTLRQRRRTERISPHSVISHFCIHFGTSSRSRMEENRVAIAHGTH